jgi:hypothetical protein
LIRCGRRRGLGTSQRGNRGSADKSPRARGASWQPASAGRLGPDQPAPRTGAGAYALTGGRLTRLVGIWLANRGIWEALGVGPAAPLPPIPLPATRAGVTR